MQSGTQVPSSSIKEQCVLQTGKQCAHTTNDTQNMFFGPSHHRNIMWCDPVILVAITILSLHQHTLHYAWNLFGQTRCGASNTVEMMWGLHIFMNRKELSGGKLKCVDTQSQSFTNIHFSWIISVAWQTPSGGGPSMSTVWYKKCFPHTTTSLVSPKYSPTRLSC